MIAVAAFPGSHEVRVIDEPEPLAPARGQVLLRVREVGICGTDREIGSFKYGLPPKGSDHLIIGHESVAEVVAVGPDVHSVAAGDLVVPMVRRPCPHAHCRPCRAGMQDFCTTGDYKERGIKQAHGFMTSMVLEDEEYLVRVPPQLREVAVLVEPLTIASKAATQAQALAARLPWERERMRGLVLGSGPVGLLGAMGMVARGVETFVYSREPVTDERAVLARGFGASYVSSADTAVDELRDRLGLVNVIFEAVGVARVAFGALAALAPNGECILSGIPAAAPPEPFEIATLMRQLVLRNHGLIGTVNASGEAYADAVDQLTKFMVLFPDSVRRLIGERFPITDAPRLLSQRAGIKDVLVI